MINIKEQYIDIGIIIVIVVVGVILFQYSDYGKKKDFFVTIDQEGVEFKRGSDIYKCSWKEIARKTDDIVMYISRILKYYDKTKDGYPDVRPKVYIESDVSVNRFFWALFPLAKVYIFKIEISYKGIIRDFYLDSDEGKKIIKKWIVVDIGKEKYNIFFMNDKEVEKYCNTFSTGRAKELWILLLRNNKEYIKFMERNRKISIDRRDFEKMVLKLESEILKSSMVEEIGVILVVEPGVLLSDIFPIIFSIYKYNIPVEICLKDDKVYIH